MNNTNYTTTEQKNQAIKPAVRAEAIRLLIVEDEPAVRRGLLMLFAAEADLEVVGEASSCETALNLLPSLCPEVVVVDAEAPRMDRLAAASALRLICHKAPVILLSLHDDPRTRARAEDAGAVAFVAKSMPSDTLLATIRQVAQMSYS